MVGVAGLTVWPTRVTSSVIWVWSRTRRKVRWASIMPVAIHRFFMSPSCQFLTRPVTTRTVEIIDSMQFVVRDVPGRDQQQRVRPRRQDVGVDEVSILGHHHRIDGLGRLEDFHVFRVPEPEIPYCDRLNRIRSGDPARYRGR